MFLKALAITADRCLIGADPEFFVKRNGHLVPAHDFELGTKLMPMNTQHGSVQVDGLALECNVRPAATRAEFVRNVFNVVNDLTMLVKIKDPLYTINAVPCANFGIKKISSLPPFAQRLGCEPDFNAYTGVKNPRPDQNSPYRTGSGHLHLGWTENQPVNHLRHRLQGQRLVQQLDFYVGLVTLLFDQDHRRRQLYGRAGAYRPKPYGVEYRVPSNKWVQSPELAGMMFDQAQKAFRTYRSGYQLNDLFPGFARDMINAGNPQWGKLRPEVKKEILG